MKATLKLTTGLLLLTLWGGANAALIEYSTGFTLNNTNNYDAGAYSISDNESRTGIVSLNRFDSSLGTLTDVEISFTSAFSHYSYASAYDSYAERYYRSRTCGSWWSGYYDCGYYVYNNEASVSGSSSARLTVDLIDPNGGIRSAFDSNPMYCRDRDYSNTTSSCSDSENDVNNPFSGTLNLTGLALTSFIGADPIDLRLTNQATFSASCGTSYGTDSCRGWNDVYWGGRMTVSYTYTTAISEPGVLGMLGLGLLGLGMMRRRRESM